MLEKMNRYECSNQGEIDFSGKSLRDQGIQKAVDHADNKVQKWSDLAWNSFLKFIDRLPAGETFQMEDFRNSDNGLPNPPSLRAFGFIPLKAAKAGLIKSIGTAKVTNPKAHQANAGLWEKI